ncbi:MAG: endonuclease/exonuclease/phosphatase family protein [Pseudomonadota bacterium]
MLRLSLFALAATLFLMASPSTALDVPAKAPDAIRFATYNVSLFGEAPGDIIARLQDGDAQARLSAEIIQRVGPDVLLIQELDRDEAGRALNLYADQYLAVSQSGAEPMEFPHRLSLPSNTGVPSGVDLSANGFIGESGVAYARDAKGFGLFPGQYAFSLVSKFPLGPARTFTDFLWRDLPGHRIPADVPELARDVLPLSSKTHALIPVMVGDATIFVAAAHPTPPLRPELARRNADEIRLLADLLHEARSQYARDDEGNIGGLPGGALAIAMGDLNADPDPKAGDSLDGAIGYLIDDPSMNDPVPRSQEGTATAAFSRGDMRVDYVVPTANLKVLASGIARPARTDPLFRASDHFLVWVDIARPSPAQ